jgi:hypothetical protein
MSLESFGKLKNHDLRASKNWESYGEGQEKEQKSFQYTTTVLS